MEALLTAGKLGVSRAEAARRGEEAEQILSQRTHEPEGTGAGQSGLMAEQAPTAAVAARSFRQGHEGSSRGPNHEPAGAPRLSHLEDRKVEKPLPSAGKKHILTALHL